VLRNGLANWTGFAAQVCVTFVTAPIIVHRLGDLRYGLWSLVESILAYLMLFDLGLTASVVRYTSKYDALEDVEQRNRVFSTSIFLFALVGLIALGVSVLLALFSTSVFDIPAEVSVEGRWMFILLGLNLAIGLPMNVFPSILAGLSKYPLTSAIRTACLLVRSGMIVAAVTQGHGLIGLALAITAGNLLEHLALAIAVRRCLTDFRFSVSLVDRKTFAMIRGYSLNAMFIAINHRISFKTDPIVIGLFLGPAAITPFAIGKKLVGHATSSFRAFTQVLTPAVSAMDAIGEQHRIRRLMLEGSRLGLWCVIPIEIWLLVMGEPFLTLWIGPRLAEEAWPVLAIMAVPLVFSIAQSVSTRILFGTDGIRWLAWTGAIQALSNIGLSLLLVTPLGIAGVALGTAIPHVVYNLAVEHHVCKKLGIGLRQILAESYVKPLLSALLLISFWLACRLVPHMPQLNWFWLIALSAIGVIGWSVLALVIEGGFGSLLRGLQKATARAGRLVSPKR
jgi:O-antigen/teichoic acid export membrane protein